MLLGGGDSSSSDSGGGCAGGGGGEDADGDACDGGRDDALVPMVMEAVAVAVMVEWVVEVRL